MELSENIDLIKKWNNFHALIVLLSFGMTLVIRNTIILAVPALLSFLLYIKLNIGTLKRLQPLGGYANMVTTVRLIIILLCMALWPWISNSLFLIGLIIFVVLDLLDGYLARNFNHNTIFGQYYDMEVDAIYVLFVCVVLYFKEIADLWLLLPGCLRYVFALYIWNLSSKRKIIEEGRKQYAAVIAGLFFISLLISVGIQHTLQDILLIISSLLIVLSFCISFYQLHFS